ncbi:MAG TPA: hypothetical protein VM582_05580 [Candidatus Thermoplasmatota archaeon]|nr:hypothetical protein [Candidatus Thermoplasmatota archaeon]
MTDATDAQDAAAWKRRYEAERERLARLWSAFRAVEARNVELEAALARDGPGAPAHARADPASRVARLEQALADAMRRESALRLDFDRAQMRLVDLRVELAAAQERAGASARAEQEARELREALAALRGAYEEARAKAQQAEVELQASRERADQAERLAAREREAREAAEARTGPAARRGGGG